MEREYKILTLALGIANIPHLPHCVPHEFFLHQGDEG